MPAIGDLFGKASISSNYAIATTVDATRTIGVTVLDTVDLSKFAADTPVFFVTYKKTTNPTTGIVSVINLVSWKGLVNVGANTITNLTLAPGYVDIGNDVGDFVECIPTSYWENSLIDGIFVGHNPDGTFKLAALKTALGNDGKLVETLNDSTASYVLSGGVWSLVSGLNGAMTLFTGYINGYKNTVAAVVTRAFTASKDTYVDVLRNTSTNAFTLVYTEVANGAASPALAANSLRLAKVVTSGAAITSVTQTKFDSLGNSIYNTSSKVVEKIFTTVGANTWTKPEGLRYVIVEVIGGGGGGGGSQATSGVQVSACPGGGGGGYSRRRLLASQLGATETVTVGAGGTSPAGAAGGAGGTTTFGALAQATGGAGGVSPLSASSGGVYNPGAIGGVGTLGDLNITGMPGGMGGTFTVTNNVCYSGNGGNSPQGYGHGGRGNAANSGGDPGTGYGGGGGGAVGAVSVGAQAGGVGAQGIVIVTEFF